MPLIFTAPWLLAGLLTLPVIWWLLRATPPKPAQEPFPPLAILAKIARHDQEASKSPWWLTLLRLVLAALVIFAVAGPVWKPQPITFTGAQPVVIMIDNGWASAPQWAAYENQAQWLISNAEKNDAPVYLIATADPQNTASGPFTAAQALERLQALEPRAVPVERLAAAERLGTALNNTPESRIFYLNDGLETAQDQQAFTALDKLKATTIQLIMPDSQQLFAVQGVANQQNALVIDLLRPSSDVQAAKVQLSAYDNQGRVLAQTQADFADKEIKAVAQMTIPVELRNDIAMVRADQMRHAAATWLLDENNRRRRVGLLDASNADKAHSLLSPLHYISSALAPFADLINANDRDLSQSVDRLLEQKPSVIVLSDIGRLPESTAAKLMQWVENGGTLLRFAGPRLAAAQSDTDTKRDPLLPVQLRSGQRNLGGTLSWSTPQPVAPAPENSPFRNIQLPDDVTVLRQVLAEPSPDLMQKSWLNLADGTPLITGENRGAGRLVLFHIAPDIGWSNLPLSGGFVDLLRRLTETSGAQAANAAGEQTVTLPAYRLLDAAGNLTGQPAAAQPLVIEKGKTPEASLLNPPGLYGTEQAYKALNLMKSDTVLNPLTKPEMTTNLVMVPATKAQTVNLQGPLFALAAILLALDGLLMLWIGGTFSRNRSRNFTGKASGTVKSLLFLFALSASLTAMPFIVQPVLAQEKQVRDDSKPDDQAKIDVLDVTHLAYVITGDKATDDVSRVGLSGLNQFVADKTSLEPGAPVGINPEKDELAFYPMIYWPVDEKAPFPSEKALQRIDAYMQQGGTVIFDTRDQLSGDTSGLNGTSPATQRLRDMLDAMNVPPLAPVADNHVLSKTFFLMPDFPGRYRGSPLWAEAPADNPDAADQPADRPVRNGDGVSPILITANDLAGAWAMDENWQPLYPTVPNDPMQRIYALRGGVNMVMYVLTGNYKADQVHVPALLERLGN
ncbi:DUF4159 domain-containing protein [Pseudochrobactrum lubricantis]|uniref:DUF4159 domain-containing protein n=1 Tax=Pseudochrobactrum lubricantis TaxID=558172 RepID=UPI0035D7AA24